MSLNQQYDHLTASIKNTMQRMTTHFASASGEVECSSTIQLDTGTLAAFSGTTLFDEHRYEYSLSAIEGSGQLEDFVAMLSDLHNTLKQTNSEAGDAYRRAALWEMGDTITYDDISTLNCDVEDGDEDGREFFLTELGNEIVGEHIIQVIGVKNETAYTFIMDGYSNGGGATYRLIARG